MKIFVCNKSDELINSTSLINEFKIKSTNSIIFNQEIEHSTDWKIKVTKKMEQSDFILFILGKDIFKSENLQWELSKAEELNKSIISLKASNCTDSSIDSFRNNYIFENVSECWDYVMNEYKNKQLLLVEQYKMMTTSTEKVTQERSKINNLFITIISSLISITFLVGKSLDFNIIATIVIIIFMGLALLSTYSWEKLIKSYANLNKGKFLVIDKLEKQLNINMFKDEWDILTNVINYESNSKTERSIAISFRWFIFITLILEVIYLLTILKQ